MSHADRDDFPEFQRAEPGLDVDAVKVVGLAVDAQAGKHSHFCWSFTSAYAAVEHEPAPPDGLLRIGCLGLNEMNRKISDRPVRLGTDALPRLHLALVALFRNLGIQFERWQRMDDPRRICLLIDIDATLMKSVPGCL
jgi:hypothetical protein